MKIYRNQKLLVLPIILPLTLQKTNIFIQDEEENKDPRIMDLIPILQPNLIIFLEFLLPNSFLGSRDHSNI